MGVKLFKLRDVPDDEAEEIRQLLQEHEIELYETAAGGWGISVPAIWLYDESDLEQARELIEEYQQQRALLARVDYQSQKEQGLHETVIDKIMQQPLRFVLFMLMSLFVIYVTLAPFVDFLQ